MAQDIEQQLMKTYAPAVVRRLSALPSKDQRPIASWLFKTPIGTNYALQILEHLTDLAKKEEAAASKILTQVLKENAATLDKSEALPKEQGRQLCLILERRLHPTSLAHAERFQAFVKSLNLPKAVRLVPPKNFEGTQYHLDICFEDAGGLQQQLSDLQTSLAENHWQGLKEF